MQWAYFYIDYNVKFLLHFHEFFLINKKEIAGNLSTLYLYNMYVDKEAFITRLIQKKMNNKS